MGGGFKQCFNDMVESVLKIMGGEEEDKVSDIWESSYLMKRS